MRKTLFHYNPNQEHHEMIRKHSNLSKRPPTEKWQVIWHASITVKVACAKQLMGLQLYFDIKMKRSKITKPRLNRIQLIIACMLLKFWLKTKKLWQEHLCYFVLRTCVQCTSLWIRDAIDSSRCAWAWATNAVVKSFWMISFLARPRLVVTSKNCVMGQRVGWEKMWLQSWPKGCQLHLRQVWPPKSTRRFRAVRLLPIESLEIGQCDTQQWAAKNFYDMSNMRQWAWKRKL